MLTWCTSRAQPVPDMGDAETDADESFRPIGIPQPDSGPRPAWERHEQTPSRHCPTYECPAGLRPIQKKESFRAGNESRIETVEHCPKYNFTDKLPIDQDAFGFYHRALAKCCQLKYVCVQMCGVPFDHCYKTYWNCALHQCNRARDLLIFMRNDSNMQNSARSCWRTAVDNGMQWLTWNQSKTLADVPKKDRQCKGFKEVQASYCECVPKDKWEERLKSRAEDFLRIHAPHELDAKGHFKNKKMWKAYRGKRWQLMFDMVAHHSTKVVKTLPGPEPIGAVPTKSLQDRLDGKLPDSVLALPKGADGMPMITNADDGRPRGIAAYEALQRKLMEEDKASATIDRDQARDYQLGMYRPGKTPEVQVSDPSLEIADEDRGMGGRSRGSPRATHTSSPPRTKQEL